MPTDRQLIAQLRDQLLVLGVDLTDVPLTVDELSYVRWLVHNQAAWDAAQGEVAMDRRQLSLQDVLEILSRGDGSLTRAEETFLIALSRYARLVSSRMGVLTERAGIVVENGHLSPVELGWKCNRAIDAAIPFPRIIAEMLEEEIHPNFTAELDSVLSRVIWDNYGVEVPDA